MSSEHTQDEPRQRRSRRSPLILAAAAVAVLAAGGGGAYWASTASSGGGDTAPGGDGAPPPLALDSAPGPGPSGGGNGIAPGEPDPNGVVYRASVKLPGGPGKAAVHQPRGTVDEADVNRLAKVLGIEGTARLEGDTWKAGATKDGSGPTLTVSQKAPGTWTFARYGIGGSDNCPKGKMCPMHTTGADAGDGAAGGAPVSEEAAKAAAAPVLKALGEDDAKLDAKEILASARVVNADPVVDGLPTYGWTTGIQVGPDGQVVGGSGHLKTPDKGATYPVLSADQTLAQLNSHTTERPRSKDCAAPVPLDGQPTKGRLPSDPQGNIQPCKQGTPSTVTIDGATFGLAAQFVDGVQALVPSWLFEVKPPAGQPFTITAPAVAPQYIAKPPAPPTGAPVPAPSGSATAGDHGQALVSYAVAPDGRTLTVTFWGGVCSTYTATADESGGGVRVKVTGQVKDPKKMCVLLAKQQTVQVQLHEALGARQVIDADTGKELPKK
ncbi:hypothetical protein [Streptomyces sp. SDr-06]|uniref:hypothetical protein n=1 Tax=Streptomyces sp. SDr-06 TaxID=2267702 RepID=UPI000DE8AB10|nr:hypothetical protein [Streptomyces sp. SDr-06]RCH69527.1 hypothetical protein DT019_06455 [Streptomyces sp. SDr-06]